jgi:hypothetical protein
MDRPRLIRGLRIAWTVGCGILCVLLIALWVRSYWRHDTFWIRLATNRITGIISVAGSIGFGIGSNVFPEIVKRRFSLVSGVTDRLSPHASGLDFRNIRHSHTDMEVRTPHWFPVLLTAALAALSSSPRRSSRSCWAS